MVLVISTSLNRNSRSRVLAREVYNWLEAQSVPRDWMDLQQLSLPQCDATDCYRQVNVIQAAQRIAEARGVIIASPVYNYDLSAAAKNLVELTGPAWADKVVGFVCAAGGHISYMAVLGLANSLMLDYRVLVIPRFVFATESCFDATLQLTDASIRQRLQQLGECLIQLCGAQVAADSADVT